LLPTPATFTPSWQHDWSLDASAIASITGWTNHLLLDARAPERFEGRVEPLDRIAGHIPGALNYPYRSNLAADNTLLPAEVLRTQLENVLGGHPPEQTVMYCGSGVSACHNLLAMEHAGLRGARLYVGSWSEWSADPHRPVETGPSKR
jgi:thiosulfate/3-mercaptopyruvate sulfurtransferase